MGIIPRNEFDDFNFSGMLFPWGELVINKQIDKNYLEYLVLLPVLRRLTKHSSSF